MVGVEPTLSMMYFYRACYTKHRNNPKFLPLNYIPEKKSLLRITTFWLQTNYNYKMNEFIAKLQKHLRITKSLTLIMFKHL